MCMVQHLSLSALGVDRHERPTADLQTLRGERRLRAQCGSTESVLRAHAARKSTTPLQNHRCIAEGNAAIQAACSKSKIMLATAESKNRQWRNFSEPRLSIVSERVEFRQSVRSRRLQQSRRGIIQPRSALRRWLYQRGDPAVLAAQDDPRRPR
jgi:hypothetical protein